MPSGVEESVEKVEDHGSDESLGTVVPVDLVIFIGGIHSDLARSLILLPSVATAPDGESQNEKDDERDFCADTAANARNVEGVADDESAEDLG